MDWTLKGFSLFFSGKGNHVWLQERLPLSVWSFVGFAGSHRILRHWIVRGYKLVRDSRKKVRIKSCLRSKFANSSDPILESPSCRATFNLLWESAEMESGESKAQLLVAPFFKLLLWSLIINKAFDVIFWIMNSFWSKNYLTKYQSDRL